MKNKDQIQGFLFEHANIRGQLVHLNESFLRAIKHHHYPPSIQQRVGEFMVSAALLGNAIKVPGTLSVQAQGTGDLPLIVAECSNQHSLRAVARWQGLAKGDLGELLGTGQLAITLEPEGGQRYQGIVPLVGSQLSQSLESYFSLSEQIPSRVWLATESRSGACGLLLQKIPASAADDHQGDEEESWNRICQLTNTLTAKELEQLDNEQLLFRLYHEESIRVFPPEPLEFHCTCSQERTLKSLLTLGEQEIDALFQKQEIIQIKCEFCGREFCLSHNDLQPYLLEQQITETVEDINPNRTIH